MPPRSAPARAARALLCTAIASTLVLATAGAAFANSDPARAGSKELFERVRAAKRDARAPLLPQTRYTVRKQIESIEPVSWLERYGKVQVRELDR